MVLLKSVARVLDDCLNLMGETSRKAGYATWTLVAIAVATFVRHQAGPFTLETILVDVGACLVFAAGLRIRASRRQALAKPTAPSTLWRIAAALRKHEREAMESLLMEFEARVADAEADGDRRTARYLKIALYFFSVRFLFALMPERVRQALASVTGR